MMISLAMKENVTTVPSAMVCTCASLTPGYGQRRN
jgi:hypothetical protein